jgi:hypothetical protein
MWVTQPSRLLKSLQLGPEPRRILGKKVCNDLQLTVGVSGEQRRKGLLTGCEQLARPLDQFGRWLNDDSAPVLGIPDSANTSFALEPVQEIRDRCCGETRVGGNLSSRQSTVTLERAHRFLVRRMQVQQLRHLCVEQHCHVAVIPPDACQFQQDLLAVGP